jgi:hypothetical protein
MRGTRLRGTFLAILVSILIAVSGSALGEELPDGTDLYRRAASVTDWIYEAESVRLRAALLFAHGPEAVAQRKLKYAKEDGNRFDPANPIWAGRLSPQQTGHIDLAWDRQRIRSETEIEGSLHETRIWNGQQGFGELQFAGYGPSPVALTGDVPREIADSFFGWLPWHETGYHMSPRRRLWSNNAESRDVVEQKYGAGAEWRCWGAVEFDGTKCWLVHRAKVGDWDRYYIEVATGRIRGIRQGSLGKVWGEAIESIIAKALRERGMAPADGQSTKARFAELPVATKKEIQRAVKDLTTAASYESLPRFEPCFETILTDYREVGPGHFFPMRQRLKLFEMLAGGPYIDEQREAVIEALQIDKPLDQRLFEWSIPENAEVFDTTRDVPLRYRQDSQRSEEEWMKLIATARAAQNAADAIDSSLKALIGRRAPTWPADLTWLNSEPLTWEKLRGHCVVIAFWNIGCGPCWGANGVPYIEAVHRHEVEQEEEQDRVVTISIHGSGATEAQIRESIAEHNMPIAAPIVIDAVDKESPWDRLTGAYRVKRMPFAIVVDPHGVIAGYGDVQDVVSQARNLQRAAKAK